MIQSNFLNAKPDSLRTGHFTSQPQQLTVLGRDCPTIEAVTVRYWVNGEDENYERELDRVSRFGGVPPAPMSPSDVAGVVLLVGTQAVLLTSVIVAFVLSLR